jgi:hypothetical protein
MDYSILVVEKLANCLDIKLESPHAIKIQWTWFKEFLEVLYGLTGAL